MRHDVVVIGSGMAGVSAALFLALSGRSVVVVERHPRPMPLVRRFRRGGISCDPGFHYTGGLAQDFSGGPGAAQFTIILRFLGIDGRITPVPLDPEGFDEIRLDGKPYLLPYGFARLRERLAGYFPESGRVVGALLDTITGILEENPYTNFTRPHRPLESTGYERVSLGEFLRSRGGDPRLIALLGGHAEILSGAGAEEIPLSVYAYIMGGFYSHAAGIVGGGDAIVGAFLGRAREAGVEFLSADGAEALEIDHRRTLTAVRLESGGILPTDTCVFTAHPAHFLRLAGESNLRPIFRRRLAGFENSDAPFVAFFRPDIASCGVSRRRGFIDLGPDSGVRGGEYGGKLGGKTAIMHCLEGTESRTGLAVIRYLDPAVFAPFLSAGRKGGAEGEDRYLALKQEMARQAAAVLADRLSVHPQRCLPVASASPVTYHRYTGTASGSMYGLKQSVRTPGLGVRAPIRGVYFAGQSLMPGVLGSLYSSLAAVTEIIDPSKLWEGLRRCV